MPPYGECGVKYRLVILCSFFVFTGVAAAQSSRSGVVKLEFTSKVFHNRRTLRVLLPRGYSERQNASRRYPVLYLNDGYAVFAYWNAEDAIHKLAKAQTIEPVILVGIDNAGERERANEYLPYADDSLQPPLPHPQGQSYPRFLVDEVMPLINRKFRTKTDANSTGLGGASYGSYISLYTATHTQGMIGKLLLESTPLYIADFRILEDVRNAKGLPMRVSIEAGSKETPDDEINQHVAENARKLEAAIHEAAPKSRTRVIIEQGGEHNSESWKRRLPDALRFLYNKD